MSVNISIDNTQDPDKLTIGQLANQVHKKVFPANVALQNHQPLIGNLPAAQCLLEKHAEKYISQHLPIPDNSFSSWTVRHMHANAGAVLACRAGQCQGINTVLGLLIRDTILAEEVYLCCINKPLSHVFIIVKNNAGNCYYADAWTIPAGVERISPELYLKILKISDHALIPLVEGGHDAKVERYRQQSLRFLQWPDTTAYQAQTEDKRCVPLAWIQRAFSLPYMGKYNPKKIDFKAMALRKMTVDDIPQLQRWTATQVIKGLTKLKVPKKPVLISNDSVDSLYNFGDNGDYQVDGDDESDDDNGGGDDNKVQQHSIDIRNYTKGRRRNKIKHGNRMDINEALDSIDELKSSLEHYVDLNADKDQQIRKLKSDLKMLRTKSSTNTRVSRQQRPSAKINSVQKEDIFWT